jgi:hypothetical protein
MDGYMKLSRYGIEIYAAIDGYSRYILWIYVGISTRTAISVYKQYVNAVLSFGYIPQIIRTDLGGETIHLGDAHWALRRVDEPEIAHADCYSYGKSTENTRIESWWAQLSRSSMFIWRVSTILPVMLKHVMLKPVMLKPVMLRPVMLRPVMLKPVMLRP